MILRRASIQQVRVWASSPGALAAMGLAVGYAGNALAQLILVRRVAPLEFGQYAATLALAATTVALPSFGLDTWLLAQGRVTGVGFAAIWYRLLTLRVALLLGWAGLLGVVGMWLPRATYPTPILVGLIAATGFESVSMMTLAALRSRQAHGNVATIQIVWAVLLLVMALFLPLGEGGLVWFTTARAGLAGLVAGVLVTMMWPRPLPQEGPSWRELLRAGRAYCVSEVATLVYRRGDLVLTGLLLGAAAAAVYGPAISLLSVAFVLPMAAFYASTPALSRAVQGPDFARAGRRHLARQAALGAVLTAGLWLVAPLATVVLGSGYGAVVGVVTILAPIGLLRALNAGLGTLMIAGGRQSVRAQVQVGVAVVALVGNLAAIPLFGVMGVAWVFVLCEALLTAGYWWWARDLLARVE